MPYRPDPIFNDSLEPDAPIPASGTVHAIFVGALCLCFALVVTVCIGLRAVFDAPYTLLKRVLR